MTNTSETTSSADLLDVDEQESVTVPVFDPAALNQCIACGIWSDDPCEAGEDHLCTRCVKRYEALAG